MPRGGGALRTPACAAPPPAPRWQRPRRPGPSVRGRAEEPRADDASRKHGPTGPRAVREARRLRGGLGKRRPETGTTAPRTAMTAVSVVTLGDLLVCLIYPLISTPGMGAEGHPTVFRIHYCSRLPAPQGAWSAPPDNRRQGRCHLSVSTTTGQKHIFAFIPGGETGPQGGQ